MDSRSHTAQGSKSPRSYVAVYILICTTTVAADEHKHLAVITLRQVAGRVEIQQVELDRHIRDTDNCLIMHNMLSHGPHCGPQVSCLGLKSRAHIKHARFRCSAEASHNSCCSNTHERQAYVVLNKFGYQGYLEHQNFVLGSICSRQQ